MAVIFRRWRCSCQIDAFVYLPVSDTWPLAFESGKWAWHEGSKDAPVIVSGRYSAQWVKRDGHWLIRGEVFTALHCESVGCNQACDTLTRAAPI